MIIIVFDVIIYYHCIHREMSITDTSVGQIKSSVSSPPKANSKSIAGVDSHATFQRPTACNDWTCADIVYSSSLCFPDDLLDVSYLFVVVTVCDCMSFGTSVIVLYMLDICYIYIYFIEYIRAMQRFETE